MSKRLSLENNRLTAVSVDSTGFKTVLGSGVPNITKLTIKALLGDEGRQEVLL